MKNPAKALFCLLAIFLSFSSALEAKDAPKKTVKLLTIGNSFANNATEYLPAMVQAAGNDLLLFRANPGGCSFQRHATAMQAFEANPADPAGRLYKNGFFPVKHPEQKSYSLQEALDSEKWDFVTIQQYSNDSYKYETFEPYTKDIIECIRKHAPQAEILIHQTWAYRQDYPGFANGAFDQQKMYDGLTSAYGKLSETYHLRMIPVGAAIQEARTLPRWSFKFPDPSFNYKEPMPGTMPNQAGSLNVGWTVTKTKAKPALDDEQAPVGSPAAGGTAAVVVEDPAKKTEKLVATLDFKHCNAEGKYLGACVWYGFLFGGKVADLTYTPPSVKPEDAVALRGIADQVLVSVRPAALLK